MKKPPIDAATRRAHLTPLWIASGKPSLKALFGIEAFDATLGALELRTMRTKARRRYRKTATGQGRKLFLYEALTGLLPYRKRFEELGLSDLLDIPATPRPENNTHRTDGSLRTNEPLYERRICTALGVHAAIVPAYAGNRDNKQKQSSGPEAEAWFLTNFVHFHRPMMDLETSDDQRLAHAIALGRLIEWWRWRRDGLDRLAASKKNSEAALSKARRARLGRTDRDEPDWWDDARLRADAMKRRNPSRSRTDIARQIGRENGRSARQVAKVIKHLWE